MVELNDRRETCRLAGGMMSDASLTSLSSFSAGPRLINPQTHHVTITTATDVHSLRHHRRNVDENQSQKTVLSGVMMNSDDTTSTTTTTTTTGDLEVFNVESLLPDMNWDRLEEQLRNAVQLEQRTEVGQVYTQRPTESVLSIQRSGLLRRLHVIAFSFR